MPDLRPAGPSRFPVAPVWGKRVRPGEPRIVHTRNVKILGGELRVGTKTGPGVRVSGSQNRRRGAGLSRNATNAARARSTTAIDPKDQERLSGSRRGPKGHRFYQRDGVFRFRHLFGRRVKLGYVGALLQLDANLVRMRRFSVVRSEALAGLAGGDADDRVSLNSNTVRNYRG